MEESFNHLALKKNHLQAVFLFQSVTCWDTKLLNAVSEPILASSALYCLRRLVSVIVARSVTFCCSAVFLSMSFWIAAAFELTVPPTPSNP